MARGMLRGGRLIIATHNQGKAAEFAALFRPLGIATVAAGALGLAEPEETGTTFAENARLKARAAAAHAGGLPALADDSGIEIEALDGAPGVFTANWAETTAGRDFGLAMRKVNALLEVRRAPRPRRARFVCTLCLAWPDGSETLVAGEARGEVVWPMRGTGGHGFDPIFLPAGETLTFGEMAPERKNRISHRADAFRLLAAALRGEGEAQ